MDDSNDPADDLLEAERTSVDFNVRWYVRENMQIYFDALNLNDAEDARFYRGGNTTPTGPIFGQIETHGTTYQLGIRGRF